MNLFINSYKTNHEYKLFIDFVVIFILGQILIGLILFNTLHFNREVCVTYYPICKIISYLKNLFIFSFYIYSSILLLKDAQFVKFKIINYNNIRKYLCIYWVASFFLTIVAHERIYSLISYLGKLIYDFFKYNI